MKKIITLTFLLLLVSCGLNDDATQETKNNDVTANEVKKENVEAPLSNLVFYKSNDWESSFKTVLADLGTETKYSFIDFEGDLTPELIVKNKDEFYIIKYESQDKITKIDIPTEYIEMSTYFYKNKNIDGTLIGFGDIQKNFLVDNTTYGLHDGKLVKVQDISFSEGLSYAEQTSPYHLKTLVFYDVADLKPIETYYGAVFLDNDKLTIWANDKLSIYGDEFNYDLMSRSLYVKYKATSEIGLIIEDFNMPIYNTETNTLAFLIGYEWEEVGSMLVYDVESKNLKTANLVIDESNKPSLIGIYKEYILFVDMYSWGTVAQGGNINVYDIKNDVSYPLVVCEEKNVQIVDFKIDDNLLKYKYVVFDDEMNLYETFETDIILSNLDQSIETKVNKK